MVRLLANRRGVLAAMTLLALPAMAMIYWPQGGDQALFAEGARRLVEGGVYWRDFWDVKQPGIFWFYAVSESVHAGVLGVRLLEIAALLVAGVVVLRICAAWGIRGGVLVLAPAVVLVPYALAARANGVGQVEGVLTLPLLLHYHAARSAFASTSRGATAAWGFAAGLCAATIAIFKLMYLPVGLVLLVTAWAESRSQQRRDHLLLVVFAGWLGGLLVPAAIVVVYSAAHGMVDLVIYSTFTAPGEQLATGLFSWSAAVWSLRTLALAIVVTGPLAGLAVFSALRQRRAGREIALVGWLFVAVLLAVPQLPTTYRVLWLLPPIGLLAVLGLDEASRWLGQRPPALRVLGVGMLVLAVSPSAVGVARLGDALRDAGPSGWSLTEEDLLSIGDRIGGSPMIGPASLMQETITPGSAIYVFGDPVVYRVLRARQAIEMNGWGPEIMSDRMWAEIVRELERSRPEWIFVEEAYQQYIDPVRSLDELLSSSYTPISRPGAGGTWWRTDDPGTPAPSPEGNQVAAR